MKQKLTFLMATVVMIIAMMGNVWGQNETATLVSSTNSSYYHEGFIVGVSNGTDATWSSDAFTMTQHKNNSSSAIVLTYAEIRVYVNHSLEFTPAAGTEIVSVEANATSSTYANALGGKNTTNCSLSVTGSTVTITPDDGTQSFTVANSAQSRLSTIVITYTIGGAPQEKVATPSFTPASGYFTESQEVSIACETEGATIYYTDDNWTTESEYTAPITLTATTTLKAKATKSGMDDSNVASATYTKVNTVNCAEANALAANTIVALNPVTVSYVNGAYVYVKDASGETLVYDFNYGLALNAGDQVSGIIGKASPYNGLPELKPEVTVDALTITTGTAPEPTALTAAPTAAEVNMYVRLNNVEGLVGTWTSGNTGNNLTGTFNGSDVVFRNNFKLGQTFTEGIAYDVVGTVAVYNSTVQVYFISATQVADEQYAINITPSANGTVTTSPASQAPEGATVTIIATPDDDYSVGSITVTGRTSGNDVPVEGNAFTMPAEDVDIEVEFEYTPKYDLVYKANGGVGEDITVSKYVGENVTIASCSFTYEGMIFVKWNTAADGSGTDYNPNDVFTMTSDGLILFAQWGESPYLFYESFNTNNGTGGNDGSWSGTIATNDIQSDNEGWTFANGKGADQCAKFGTGSLKGSAQTPEINISNGQATISFKAGAWNGNSEKTTLNISATNGTLSQASVTLEKGAWTSYTIAISGVTAPTQITFEAAESSNNRFFLDEVMVTSSNAPAVPTFSPAAGTYFENQSVTITAEEGCTIYYTTNGNTPTTESTQYTEAIQLTVPCTTTIKAIAVDADDQESEVASATYTLKRTQYTPEQLLAELEPTSSGIEATVVFDNNVIDSIYVTSQGYRNGMYLDIDGEEDFYVYCYNVPTEWVVGGKVSGTVTGSWKIYNSTKEFCPENYDDFSYTAPQVASYTITIDPNITNGTVTADATQAIAGTTITLTVTPDEGYKFGTLTVTDATDNTLTVSNNQFTMPAANVNVTATFEQLQEFSVTYTVLGESVSGEDVVEGQLCAEVPEVTDAPEGWTFAGWTETETIVNSTTAPTLFNVATEPVTRDLDLYAVFTRSEGSNGYTKVTAEPTDWSGEYLLVYETDSKAWNGLDEAHGYALVDIASGMITEKPENAAILTIATMEGGYSIQVNGEQYIGKTEYSNGLNFSDVPLLNTLTYDADNGSVITAEGGCTMRFNNTAGDNNDRFRYYKSGQQPVQLYKADGVKYYTTVTPIVVTYTVVIDELVNGSITANPTSATAGTTINFIVTPDEGYRMKENTLIVLDDDAEEVTINGNNPYSFVMPANNVTISAEFESIPTASYLYSINGEDGDEITVAEGTSIILADGEDLNEQFKFAGWTLDEADVTNIMTAGSSYDVQDSDILFAVYSRTISSASRGTTTAEVSIADYATANGWANNEKYYTVNVDEHVSVNTNDAGSTGAYIETGSTWRMYQNSGSTWTVDAAEGCTLNSVTFTYNSDKNGIISYHDATYTSGAEIALTGSKSDNFTVVNGTENKGQARITAISVTYTTSGGSSETVEYFTRVFLNETADDNITISGPSIIPADNTLTMGSYSLTNSTAANLIIEEGAQLFHGNDGVAATVKKNIAAWENDGSNEENPADGWYLIASPINGNISTSDVAGLAGETYDLYSLGMTPGEEWQINKGESAVMANGQGYLYARNADVSIDFAGTLTASANAVSVSLNYNATTPDNSFTLVGNPFTCNATVDMSYYVLVGNVWTEKAATEPVAPCAAILVKATAADQSVTFTAAQPQ